MSSGAFTGAGALGSSWLKSSHDGLRVGYLNGVTISVADTEGDLLFDTGISPYFDGETAAVYDAAASVWNGTILYPATPA
ncbi:hypothetical protein HII36_32040 [Nonomuraea sp. NN258]|uniref:hypothetical protein n=1 Tax=Nonomuraea antri TaxID=2730852 RepID=UPI001569AC61|nr:hypothetical protein [Nonomuraea antri]NRQ36430.1 hypothetical protein [Nonomuraea antri]